VYRESKMAVVEAKIQTVEEIYRLIWTAVATKQPVRAIYKDRLRLFCPHRLVRNRAGQRRVLAISTVETVRLGWHPSVRQ